MLRLTEARSGAGSATRRNCEMSANRIGIESILAKGNIRKNVDLTFDKMMLFACPINTPASKTFVMPPKKTTFRMHRKGEPPAKNRVCQRPPMGMFLSFDIGIPESWFSKYCQN
jgi:hypothetical protein